VQCLAALTLLVAAACAAPRSTVRQVPAPELNAIALRQLSAGHVGCPSAEIEITQFQVTETERTFPSEIHSETWTARCRGVTFHCSGWRGHIACARELPPSP